MATLIDQRSTYWNGTGTGTPYTDGDMMWWWNIYYDQSESTSNNNRTKIIVDYYICTYKQTSVYADVISYSSGSMYCKINGENIGTINYSAGEIVVGDNYRLRYIGSKSTYISHNSDGTGSFTWQGFGVGRGTSLSTYTVPTITRSSVISSVGTFGVDSGVTVNTTKYVSGFYDRLQIYIGSTLIKTINNYTSRKITFTETELDNIYKAIPTGDNGTFTFKLSTYSNSNYSTQVGNSSSTTARGNLKIILPEFTVGDYTYSDSNSKTRALTTGTSTSNKIVKGYSTVKMSFINHARVYTRGATLSHYVVDGERGDVIDPSTPSGFTWYGPMYNKTTLTAFAVDSRNTSSLPEVIDFEAEGNFINYSSVTKNYDNTYERSDNGVGSQVTISFSGTWWNDNFGVVNNALTASYKYKKSTQNEYINGDTNINLSINGNKYSFNGLIKGDQDDNGFDISESYDIIVTIEDKLSSVEIKYTIPAGEPAIALYKNKASLGAMYNESLGGTQIWGDLYKDGQTMLTPYVLFTGTSNGNITASSSYSNFKFIEIYFEDNNGMDMSFTKIVDPVDDLVFQLSIIEPGNRLNTYIRRTRYTINGKSLIPNIETAGYVDIDGTTITNNRGTNYIYIKKVIGYK